MAAKKTYVVAEGYSFVAAGKIYAPGEEIAEAVFADKSVLAKLVSKKKILVKGSSKATAEAVVETSTEAKAEEAEDKE